jgi:hypothetical protein
MRHFSWLFLALFCTAFMRLQPVVLKPACHCACCHCNAPADCGMPCNQAPAPASAMVVSEQSARVAQAPTLRLERAARKDTPVFYLSFVKPAESAVRFAASPPAVPAAGVPLFKEHCSFLI